MRYFCIYEVNNKTKETSFVDNFDECINDAQEFCQSLNNFSSDDYRYCVRCLDETEFLDRYNYNPIFHSVFI